MRRIVKGILPVLLCAAVLGLLLWTGVRGLERNYVIWRFSLFDREARTVSVAGKRMGDLEAFLEFTDLRQLDARDTGMTARQYAWFRDNLPNCRVLWDVPIQGRFYPQDTRVLQVQALTEAELHSLVYLPKLQQVEVGDWSDAAMLLRLKECCPSCSVTGRLAIGGEWWDLNSVSLVLEDADPKELAEKLALFPRLESVLLTGMLPDQEAIAALQVRYPQVFFLWKLDMLGMTLETDREELDLTQAPLDSAEQLEELLPWFPKLKRVELNASGLNQEQLLALAAKHPDIHFVYNLLFEGQLISTGEAEIDLSNIPMTSTEAVESILPAFRRLRKVVMCNCGLDSETMDALNQKYPDIRFVWSVNLGGVWFRTDAVHFAPNRWGLSLDDENIRELRYCTDMVCVDIGHSVKVTSCEWAAYMPELRYLVLAETGISDLSPLENHENLVFLEIFLSKVKDYSPLATIRSLEDLNLCYTQGDPAPIGEMTWLKRLWWSGCWKGRKYLADRLPDTQKEFLSLSSTGRGWREGQHYYDMRDFIGMEYMTG